MRPRRTHRGSTRSGRHDESGGTLIPSLLLVLFFVGIVTSLVTVQTTRDRLKSDLTDRMAAYYSAEGALNYAVETIWSQFQASAVDGSLSEFRTHLDQSSIAVDQWTPLSLVGLQTASGAAVSVDVYRTDTADASKLRFRASAALGNESETIESGFEVAGEIFQGFKFAFFSKNVACTFCHLKVDNTQYVFGNGGPYPRVRVATLDSLRLRSGNGSTIAGSLYTMGKLMDKTGNPLTTPYVETYTFGADGMIDPATTSLVTPTPAPVLPDGTPAPGYNFYKDYPADPNLQSDGPVPSSFPAVFTDLNGNRLIDDAEYDAVASSATGTVSGSGYVIPQGSSFGGNSLSISASVSATGAVDGNLILVGTQANPIQIDGKVVVNGDVILKGYVRGTGTIVARGNTYVAGDLVYDDVAVNGKRQFGVAPGGGKNQLTIASGGNILVGDYLTPKNDPAGMIDGTPAAGKGFATSQIALFNRDQWQRTQQTLPDVSGNMIANSTYDPSYTPRFYVIDSSAPAYVFVDESSSPKVYWDDTDKMWKGKEHSAGFDKDVTTTPGAIFSTLNPTNPWVTPAQLKSFWAEDEAWRSGPLTIDGLLYTDSAAFAMARSGSNTGGVLVLNGSLVAQDTGILAGTEFRLNYDDRFAKDNNLNLKESVKNVQIRREYMLRTSSAMYP